MNKFNKNSSNAEIESNFAGVYPFDKIVVFLFCQLLQSDEKIGSKILFSHKLGNALVEPLRFISKKRNFLF